MRTAPCQRGRLPSPALGAFVNCAEREAKPLTNEKGSFSRAPAVLRQGPVSGPSGKRQGVRSGWIFPPLRVAARASCTAKDQVETREGPPARRESETRERAPTRREEEEEEEGEDEEEEERRHTDAHRTPVPRGVFSACRAPAAARTRDRLRSTSSGVPPAAPPGIPSLPVRRIAKNPKWLRGPAVQQRIRLKLGRAPQHVERVRPASAHPRGERREEEEEEEEKEDLVWILGSCAQLCSEANDLGERAALDLAACVRLAAASPRSAG
ncbi:unnamed protein product [Prorocentrum cordatum]|uniref:Uncharacterized protein n=1 Tax=Prorocentrum cordatum TaxID=2364126 RepID=A0ABN9TGM0_9DINO|nr:unnamed protein product [Polarella glacialis]